MDSKLSRNPVEAPRVQTRTGINWLAQLLLLGVALIWGWTFVLVKESLREIGTFTFLFYRFTLAFLLLVGLFGPRLRGVEPHVWAKGALIGLTLFLGYWFQTLGLNFTTATNSAFITGLSVVLVPVLGALVFRERVTGAAWLGATLSVLGLGLIVFGASLSFEPITLNVGDGLTFLCAVSFALQILLISRYARPENYLPILATQISVVALLSALGMLLFEGPVWPASFVAWKGIIITGVLATALAFWVQTRFQPLSTATRTAIIFSSEPVFAALFGYWLLGERLIGAQWLGALFILSAMLVAQWPSRRRVDELLARSK
jgi:drug/metabolite transporter (DMT)-like permease